MKAVKTGGRNRKAEDEYEALKGFYGVEPAIDGLVF